MLELLCDVWTRVRDDLRTSVGEAAFDAWLSELRPLALERGVCYLEGKNRVVCERVERLFQPVIEEQLSAEIGTRISINLVPAADSLVPDEIEVGPTQPIVDTSNRTAYLVLKALVDGKQLPGRLFFFYGPGGAGKTFLLRWWAQHSTVRPREFAGPGLVKAFQACLRDRRLRDLRGELLEDRPLLIDEVHRIAGHQRLQRELLAVLKTRESARWPVLIASRWHPQEIWNLDPGFAAFLVSGFLARIEEPGPEARLRYLRALEGAPSRNGRAGDIESLARQSRGGYRDLRRNWALDRQGAAYPRRYLQLIDPRSVFERVLERVAQRLDVTREDLVGKTQSRRVSFARQVLSYLCVAEGLSRAEVGRFLGGRSRAAVSYATKRLETRMAESPEIRAQVEEFL